MLRTFLNNQNWNIGFVEQPATEFIHKRTLGNVHWMKHSYQDRFFADPFIYSVDSERIVVFAEECEFDNPKGRLVELEVDVTTKKLLKRRVLLELDTHLSYPIMYREGENVYVYPENGASGCLAIYKYDASRHSLVFVKNIIEEALADATMVKDNDAVWMFATRYSASQEDLYIYKSVGETAMQLLVETPIVAGRSSARMAGDVFEVDGVKYRPAQNCSQRYGGGLEIMRVNSIEPYVEEPFLSIKPSSFKYNLGLHTINFSNNLCVVDGYGYLYPIIGRILHFLRRIVKKVR